MKLLNDCAAEVCTEPKCDRVLLKWDAASLSLAAIGEERLHRIVQSGAEVRWQRYATVRRVPGAVLRDAYRKYRNAIKRVDEDRLGAELQAAQAIHWEQTEALPRNDSSKPSAPL
jgi:hypothetical protein